MLNNITVYSQQFIQELKKALGTAKNFIKSNKQKRQLISNRIKKIFQTENFLKSLTNLNYSKDIINDLLKDEKKEFVKAMDEFLTEKIET